MKSRRGYAQLQSFSLRRLSARIGVPLPIRISDLELFPSLQEPAGVHVECALLPPWDITRAHQLSMLRSHAHFHVTVNTLVFAVHLHPLLDLLHLVGVNWGDSCKRCGKRDDRHACYGGVEVYRRREWREGWNCCRSGTRSSRGSWECGRRRRKGGCRGHRLRVHGR